jgi:hypothetical protein
MARIRPVFRTCTVGMSNPNPTGIPDAEHHPMPALTVGLSS